MNRSGGVTNRNNITTHDGKLSLGFYVSAGCLSQTGR